MTPCALEVAVAVTTVPEPVGFATVKVVSAGHVTDTRAGGALIVTVGVPVHVAGMIKSSTVSSSHRLLSRGVAVSPVQPVPVNHPIVTTGGFVDVYPAPPLVTAKINLFVKSSPRAT